jgi:hypothetical protein
MVQMLLDFTSVVEETPVVGLEALRRRAEAVGPQKTANSSRNTAQVYRSLPLYDAKNSELHHMGDLAQAVLDRYDIVRRRRAARLRREAALAQRDQASM